MDINFSNNLFIAVAELNKFKQSIVDKGWKMFARHLVKQFGISQTDNNTQFLPFQKSGENEVITIKPGVAFDSDMNIIVQKNAVDISVPAAQLSGNLKYWIVVRYKSNHLEDGTVNISADGVLTGSGTSFLSVLRGQPDFPTKVHLESQVNTGNYEVVSVLSDSSAVLAGSFTAEQDLSYSVVGTFTPGFIPDSENAQIYQYDDCEIEVITAEDVSNLNLNDGKDFLICSVNYVNATMQLQDWRIYYMLNNPYVQTLESMKELSEDGVVSMPKYSIVSLNEKGILLELQFEHGFKVTNFDTNIVTTGYRIDIQGSSNMYANAAALAGKEHLFKGWYLLNRNTMSYSVVIDSTGNYLYVEELNPDSINGSDIVLIPPFNEIEYQVTLDGNVPSPDVPYIFKFNTDNIQNKCIIPILWKTAIGGGLDSVTISLKYRMVGNGNDKYQFKKFLTSGFIGYNGVAGALSDSSFVLPISSIQPVDTPRNYS